MGKLVGLRKMKLLCGRKFVQGKNSAWLLTFEGVDSKEKVSELVGAAILVKDADRPVFNGNQSHIPELIGRPVQMKVNALITDDEKESTRRQRISLANKGRVPWNKGGNQKQVSALLTDEEKETLRRQRISQANKGKVPWNKGGRHSSETKKRIRAGVIERMKDPKIREKLRLQAEAVQLSPEIKMKIRTGIMRAWVRKKKLKVKQELCLSEWREMIAETARRGGEGDVEYEWNSSSILRKQALEAIPRKQRKPIRKPEALSAEHRLRISVAIKAKWSNPDYRINVEKGIRKAVAKRVAVPRQVRPKARPRQTFPRPLQRSIAPRKAQIHEDLVNGACGDTTTQKSALKTHVPRKVPLTAKNMKTPIVRHVVHNVKGPLTADTMEVDSPTSNADMPSYKDPEAEKKLEKLKSMRVHRMHLEVQKQKEITERARALIAQAQEAAKALEAVAVKDRAALAPLLETRKLLAEAVYSLESLNRKSSALNCIVKEDDSTLYAQVMSLANAVSSPVVTENNHAENESSSVENANQRT